MISCCILLRGTGTAGDDPLVVATFARDFIDFDSRVAPEGAGGDTGVDIPPVGYGDESTTDADTTDSRNIEPDVLLQHEAYVRFRVGWSSSGLLYFERVRLSTGSVKVDYFGGNTTLLADDEDQVFEIPKGPLRLDTGPYVVLLRPGPVDPLWPGPPESGTSRVFVRRSRLATQEDINWWLHTNKGAATALSASAKATNSQSSRRLPGIRDWSTEAHWHTGMEPGRNYKMEITLATGASGGSSRAAASSESTRIIAGNVRRPPRLVTIAPFFPGCLVLPKRRHMEPDGATMRVAFWITPQGVGDLESARVEIYVDGRPLGRVPTPSRVSRGRPAMWAGILGLMICVATPLLAMSMAGAMLISPTADRILRSLVWYGLGAGSLLAVAGLGLAAARRTRGVSYSGPLHEPAAD